MDKNIEIKISGKSYTRVPIKTKLIVYGDNIVEVTRKYTNDKLKDGDIVFISEKIVAITQGRAYPIEKVKPRKLATWLSKFVKKTPQGIGLGMPETMEMALRECGVFRILLAAGVSAVGKLLGRKGDFYRVAGYKASAIDGPTANTIPPYNKYVVLSPENPDEVARQIASVLENRVAIVDINDLGGSILGVSDKKIDKNLMLKILSDNPLGQDHQSTPIGIISGM